MGPTQVGKRYHAYHITFEYFGIATSTYANKSKTIIASDPKKAIAFMEGTYYPDYILSSCELAAEDVTIVE